MSHPYVLYILNFMHGYIRGIFNPGRKYFNQNPDIWYYIRPIKFVRSAQGGPKNNTTFFSRKNLYRFCVYTWSNKWSRGAGFMKMRSGWANSSYCTQTCKQFYSVRSNCKQKHNQGKKNPCWRAQECKWVFTCKDDGVIVRRDWCVQEICFFPRQFGYQDWRISISLCSSFSKENEI